MVSNFGGCYGKIHEIYKLLCTLAKSFLLPYNTNNVSGVKIKKNDDSLGIFIGPHSS